MNARAVAESGTHVVPATVKYSDCILRNWRVDETWENLKERYVGEKIASENEKEFREKWEVP